MERGVLKEGFIVSFAGGKAVMSEEASGVTLDC